jgi:hypothetical protein
LRRSAARSAAARHLIALLTPTNLVQSIDQRKVGNIKCRGGAPNEKNDLRCRRRCRGSHRIQARAGRSILLDPIIMESKKDKNFKAVNPYAPTKVKAAKKSKKSKSKKA